MNVLIFEWKNFGIEDICDAFKDMAIKYKCISTELMRERKNEEFDNIFENEMSIKYDCVFTFNYSPLISNVCKKHNVKYVAWVYDSPLVSLFSYTIINPCNHVYVFDRALADRFASEGITTVHYMPLAANVRRLDAMHVSPSGNGRGLAPEAVKRVSGDIAFVGSMYNEKHNLFDRLKNLPPYVSGYLDGIIQAQLKVYGYYFIEELLKPDIIDALQKSVPAEPNKDGVETTSYLYAYYFIARKLAELERKDLLGAVSKQFNTHLYTPNATPELPEIINCGPIDYYNHMPYVFNNSRINLNISLRSIRSGIPLRAMDIMGCNGFLLSNYQADFYDFFVPGEDMAVFESKEDLINKCDYYLEHDNERRQIAANGFGKVNEFHTYKVRLKEIFDVVF